jgi:tetratricopeptide (TPR) repeat protein
MTNVTVDSAALPVTVTALPLRSDRMPDPLALTLCAEEAVGVYRRLAAANPACYEADLATSLNNLSGSLAGAGRHEEALAAAEEAVTVYRRLAAANPAAYESSLATSLNNLAAEVVRRREALVASLDNVWDILALAGQHQEALDPIEEAVAIYRRLAAGNPAAHEPDLAASLDNLSDILARGGRREEARAVVEEAVAIYRRLAAANPAAYERGLAASLNHLSVLEQPDKRRFTTVLLIVLVLMNIAHGCLGIVILGVEVFTTWQEIKGQPLR